MILKFYSFKGVLLFLFLFISAAVFAKEPVVTSFTPARGSAGTLVTISGKNLRNATGVSIGKKPAILLSNDGSVLVAMVMPGATTGDVSVNIEGEGVKSEEQFTVINSVAPGGQQGNKLSGIGTDKTEAGFGRSVDISADGNTAIVGGSDIEKGQGAVWFYAKSGGQWVEEGTKLVGTGGSGASHQGFAVSISADGNTAVVGGYGDEEDQGAVWIWTRTDGVWSQFGEKLVSRNNIGHSQQGWSVDMSANGKRIVVGGKSDNAASSTEAEGAAWVWEFVDGNWTEHGKLIANDNAGPAQQGSAVAISADGSTIAVSGRMDNSETGAVWIWIRNKGSWQQQGEKLVGRSMDERSGQGKSISLNANGNTLIVGGDQDNKSAGSVWVYLRTDGSWRQQGEQFVPTDSEPGSRFGTAVSLNAEGDIAWIGGPGDDKGLGAVWIYKLDRDNWIQEGNKIVGTGSVASEREGSVNQGTSVALSADGTTGIQGGVLDAETGAMWTISSGVAPLITSFSPESGPVGTLVTITGSGLSYLSSVTVGETNNVVVSETGDSAVIMIMPGFERGRISLTNLSGSVQTEREFNVIDSEIPNSQQNGKLISEDSSSDSNFGRSIAVSADGNTSIVGAPNDNSGEGAALIYTRVDGVWSQQSKLIGSGSIGPAKQGWSVAMSADGKTAIVGGFADNNESGAAWIYVKTDLGWNEAGKFIGSEASGAAQQGYSVTMSADGKTAMIGGVADEKGAGAVWTFRRSGDNWQQQGSKLAGASGDLQHGSSLSLSANGNVAIVGSVNENGGQGSASIYNRTNAEWQLQTTLSAGDGTERANQGASVSLNANGTVALIGGPQYNNGEGAVWIYSFMEDRWSEGERITTKSGGSTLFGQSVSLNAKGDLFMVGMPGDNSGEGAARIYKYNKGGWEQQDPVMLGSEGSRDAQQGFSVSLSADGGTAISSGYTDGDGRGAMWTFASDSPLPKITSFSPKSVVKGGTVTITGANFSDVRDVTFGGVPAKSFEVISTTSIVAVLSEGASGEVVVSNSNGIATLGGFQLLSENADLSALTFNEGTLKPDFDASTTEYTISVENSVSVIKVTPTSAETGSVIMVNDNVVTSGATSSDIALNTKDNVITIEVTAPDELNKKLYTVTVTRMPSANADLAALTVSGVSLNTAFTAGTIEYSASVANSMGSLTVTPVLADGAANVKVNGNTVSSGASSDAINLNVGLNTITILVTAEDESNKTYTLLITKAASANANLSALTLSSGTLDPVFGSGTVNYTASVSNSTESVKLTPTVADATASIKVNGTTVVNGAVTDDLSLLVGANTLTIIVTAQDASMKTYKVVVTRAASANSNLSALTLSSGTLDPVFVSGTLNYTASVSNSTESIKLTPTAADANASIKINEASVISGAATDDLPLMVGPNTLTIIVTAQDASTITYKVVVTREASANANLSALSLSKATLSPVFSSVSTDYTASVDYNTNQIAVIPAVSDVNASIKVNGKSVISGNSSDNIALSVGVNTIEVEVTAPDGNSTRKYNIIVTRAGSADATLSALSISSGSLEPAFSSATTSYSTYFANSIELVNINALAGISGSAVKINGTLLQDGKTSANIPLKVGSNPITVQVTSQDGKINKTYIITANRAGISQTVPDQSGNIQASNSTNQILITSSTQTVSMSVPAGVKPPTIDYSYLVSGGVGTIPPITVNSQFSQLIFAEATKVTASSGWDGVFSTPTITSYVIPATAGQIKTTGLVIEVGSPDHSLSFDKAVRLTLTGQAGMRIGRVHNNIYTEIVTVGKEDSQAAGDALPADGSFKIDVGKDVVIWTKVFSKFLSFSQAADIDVALVEADKNALNADLIKASNVDLSAIKEQLNLPATGTFGSAITWVSSDPSIVSADGKTLVRNLFGSGSSTVTITATLKKGLITETKSFTLIIPELANQAPTLSAVANQIICYDNNTHSISLSGISAGPEGGQSTSISVNSDKPSMFSQLAINGNTLNYKLNDGVFGVATVKLSVKDNGGVADGGIDVFESAFTVTVNQLPVVSISSDQGAEISKGATVNLNASGASSYVWSSGAGIVSGQQSATLVVRPAVTTTYTVTGLNTSGCSVTKTFTVIVKDDYKALDINNVMSPDGDGVNDNLVIKNIDMFPKNSLRVFDRAGRILYTKENYNNEWNGSFNGLPLAEDTYFYILDFGGKEHVRGFVSIVRRK